MRVVATAGHVDHGKSTLIRALTGTDPDRFEEERRRGMSLDLGFAWCALPSGREVAFVDVPGHQRLVRTMVAGVGAISSCLFVVAADDGWMPQSEEHLRILEIVGARRGVVALTKIDTVDDPVIQLAREEVRHNARDSFLADAPVVAVSATTGSGIEALRAELDAMVESIPPPGDHGRPRMWLDRAFSVVGAGTVVTGTLTGGTLATGHELTAIDRRGVRRTVRIRGLQQQNRDTVVAGPGTRVAANISGASPAELGRGTVLVAIDQWRPTRMFDAEIHALGESTIDRKGSWMAYIGTSEQPVSIRPFRGRPITPGAPSAARCRLDVALPLVPGDRFVVRDAGRGATVGGATVLDVHPVLPLSQARPDATVERVIAERGVVDVDDLAALTGRSVEATHGRWVCSPEYVERCAEDISRAVERAGPLGVDLASLDERERAVLGSLPDFEVRDGRVRRPGTVDDLDRHRWLRELDDRPFDPPPRPDDVSETELREMMRRGLVVAQDGIHFSAGALEAARRSIVDLLARQPEGISLSEIRDRLATTRKFAIPIANLLDARGVTRRRGDLRIAGPRSTDPLTPER